MVLTRRDFLVIGGAAMMTVPRDAFAADDQKQDKTLRDLLRKWMSERS